MDAFLERGGKEQDVQRIRDLVTSTDGQVLTYEGNLIEATYFSCSGGTTEDAVAVWGTDVPYLQSVSSPGEERATLRRNWDCRFPAHRQHGSAQPHTPKVAAWRP